MRLMPVVEDFGDPTSRLQPSEEEWMLVQPVLVRRRCAVCTSLLPRAFVHAEADEAIRQLVQPDHKAVRDFSVQWQHDLVLHVVCQL